MLLNRQPFKESALVKPNRINLALAAYQTRIRTANEQGPRTLHLPGFVVRWRASSPYLPFWIEGRAAAVAGVKEALSRLGLKRRWRICTTGLDLWRLARTRSL
jgi:hypothetical protein